MWGGRLPDSFEIADAEMYACFKLLLNIWTKAGNAQTRKDKRVLICSDCKPAMQQIETAWRKGYSDGARKYDRGHLLEAICNIRADLGRVIMIWVPAHDGISPNAMADSAAKAHTRESTPVNPSAEIARHVDSRPCIYEQQIHSQTEVQKEAVWAMTDRRTFTETRKRARAHIRTKLGKDLKPGCTTAGVTGRIWAEVVSQIDRKLQTDMKKHKKHQPPMQGPQLPDESEQQRLTYDEVEGFNLRRTSILGMRVDNVKGITHNRGWARRRQGESNKGGPATNEEAWGCWPCKQARDRELAGRDTTTQGAMTRQQSHQQWTTEAEEQLNTKATLKHILCGECTGLPPEPDQAQQHYITSLRKTISKCNEHSSREDNTNGKRVVKALQAALGAATNVRSHTTENHEQWENRWALLAGVLPEWAENGDEDREGPVVTCTTILDMSVDRANATVKQWLFGAKAGSTFMKHRLAKKGLMQLALRAWREQVEHANIAVAADPTRWKIRKQPTRGAREVARPRANNTIGPIKHTEGKILAVNKKEDWTDINPRHRLWSPWTVRDPNAKQGGGTAHVNQPRLHPRGTTTLTETEKQWKLRDKCLRVATYYRVLAMQARSKRRIQLGLSRALFRTWASSVIQQRREHKRCEAHKQQSDNQRHIREGHASAQTRMHMRRPDLYTEQRQHKRAKIAQASAERKRKRLPTLTDTQIGHRCYENMRTIAARSVWTRDAYDS